MTISQQLGALLFNYRACQATEQDVIRGVAMMTGAARVDRLEAALRRLIEEAEIVYLQEQDDGRDMPHLRRACELALEALDERNHKAE